MKILVILGGSFVINEEMIKGFKTTAPKILQCGINGDEATPFSNHEIIVATPAEALDTFLEQSPDKLIFAGTLQRKDKKDSKEGLPHFMLVERILKQSIGGDRSRFLYTNPISVPPFHKEPNFFLFMDITGMANWFGLS